MAYVLDTTKQARTDGVNAASVTFDDWFGAADGLLAGDYIMVAASNQTGLDPLTLTSATGTWERLDNIDTPRLAINARSQVWWSKYDGITLPTGPTVGGGSTAAWAAVAWVVRDAPDVTDQSWIDVNARVDNATLARVLPVPSVTTTEAECLLLTVLTTQVAGAFATPDAFWGVDLGVARVNDNETVANPPQQVILATRAAPAAGATPAYDYVSGVSGGVRLQAWTIAIKNKTGGVKPIGIANPPTRVFDFFADGTFLATNLTQISTIHATIDGQATFAAASTALSTVAGAFSQGVLDWYRRITLTPPAATTGVCGARWDLPATTDYTTGLWCLFYQRASSAADALAGAYHYFEDGAGNWSVYQFVTRVEGAGFNTIVRHLPDETRVDGSSTPPNLAAITKRGIAYRQTSSGTGDRNFHLRAECIQPFAAPLTLTGGGPNNPITARTVAQMLRSGAAWRLAFTQGQGQQVITMPFQLGDGVRETYVDDEAQALEYPRIGGIVGYTVQQGRQEIRVKASANDTIIFDASIKGTSRPHNLVFDAATSTSATYGMAGTFLGWVPTLKTGLTLRGGSYIGCGKIDAKGANVSDSTVKASIATDAAMRLEDTGRANRCEFTKGAETYAIEIAGTGTIALAQTTYTGYTKPLNILATTGTVTIELDAGDAEPLFDTAGATVVFSKPVPTQSVTVSNGIAGTLLLIQDVTNPASPITLYLDTPSSWPHTWQDASPYVADRDIRVRAAYQNGATAKMFIDEVIGTSTNAAPALSYRLNQEDDTVYNTNALNGATVTGVTIDDAALLVEVDVGTITWAAIYAHEVYWLATAAGIVDEGRIISAPDPANYIFEGPWKVKNTSSPSVPLTITGGYGRSAVDGTTATLIDATGGTVFAAPDQVIAVASGSGVTAQDRIDIAAAVLAAAQAAPMHADIRKVNDLTIIGAGTAGSPFGPV